MTVDNRSIRVSLGDTVRSSKTTQKVFADVFELARYLRKRGRTNADAYFTAPMKGARSKANALPTRIVVMDYDALTPGDLECMKRVLRRFRGFAYTTRNHTATAPRLRVVLELSDVVGADDYRALYHAIGEELSASVRGEPRSLHADSSGASIAQPMFVPSRGASMFHFKGNAIEVKTQLARKSSGIAIDFSEANGAGIASSVRRVLDGVDLHDSTLALTAQLATRTRDASYAAALVRALMDASSTKRDRRFKQRYADVQRLAEDAIRRLVPSTASEGVLAKLANPQIPVQWLEEPPPPVPHLVKDWIPRGVTALLVAEGGVGKTTLALKLCLAVALGGRWLGFPVEQGRAIYIGIEDPPEMLRRRLWSLLGRAFRSRQTEMDAPSEGVLRERLIENLSIVSLVGEQLHLVQVRGGQVIQEPALDGVVDLLRGYDLVVLDPLARLHGGDENSNAVGTALVNAIEKLVQASGATAVIPHHTGKANERSDAYRARGASAIPDGARGLISLEVATEDDCKNMVNVDPHDYANGGILKLVHGKNSYGPKAKPIWLQRAGEDLHTFVPEYQSGDPGALQATLVEWMARRREPVFLAEIREHYRDIFGRGVSRSTAESTWKTAVASGTLEPRNSADNPKSRGYVLARHVRDIGHTSAGGAAVRPEHGGRAAARTGAAGSVPRAAAGVRRRKRTVNDRTHASSPSAGHRRRRKI